MTLTIASWPGYGPTQNSFLRIFLDGVADAHCRVRTLNSVDDMASLDEVDCILLHWPQRVFWEASSRRQVPTKVARFLYFLRNRPSATKLVWLAHDLQPHDAQGFQTILWKPMMAALTQDLDAFVTLSVSTVDSVERTYPKLANKPRLSLRHPAYPGQTLSDLEVEALRRAEGLEAKHRVVGYCGQLRNNKGLDVLVRAFRALDMPDARLYVAGSATRSAGTVVDDLRAYADADPRIHLNIGDLDDQAFWSALLICDLVAAPFRQYLHSGSLIHALSANRPVLTPSTHFSDDLVNDVGAQWVRTYEGDLSPSQLEAAIMSPKPTGTCLTSDFDPAHIGRELAVWLRMLSSS